MYTYISIYLQYTYTYICIHTYIFIYTHTRTHTQAKHMCTIYSEVTHTHEQPKATSAKIAPEKP